jgi:hypothetical protein
VLRTRALQGDGRCCARTTISVRSRESGNPVLIPSWVLAFAGTNKGGDSGAQDCALSPCGRGHPQHSNSEERVRGLSPSPNSVRCESLNAPSHEGRGYID